MTLYYRPQHSLRLNLFTLMFMSAAAMLVVETEAAPIRETPSLMEICAGTHDPIALEEAASAEGELRFTIIATDEDEAAPAEGSEQRFRRWGVGWHGDPCIRFRSTGGWYFTLQGRIVPQDSEGSRDSINEYYSDEDHDYSSSDEIRRNFLVGVSRQFGLWRRLSLGPVLQLKHSYWRKDNEYKSLDIYNDEQTYRLSESWQTERRESYGLALGLMPMWSFGERLSLETSFCLRYYRTFSKYESRSENLDSDGSYSEHSSSNSSTSDGFNIDSKYFTADMALGLYFYF